LKSKQAVSVVAFVGGAISVQFVLQSLIQSFNPALIGGLAEAGEILSVVYMIFPGTGFAANALELSGTSALVNLEYFITASAAAFGLFLLAGKFLYFEGLVGIGEHASRREAVSSDELEKKTAASPKPVTYYEEGIQANTSFTRGILQFGCQSGTAVPGYGVIWALSQWK
jgi:hypothetical protein